MVRFLRCPAYFIAGISALALVFLSAPTKALETSKPLIMRSEPTSFSPNSDGLEDQIFFYPVLNTKGDAQRWRLDISSSRRVARLNGAGLPALIKWDGLDKKGNPVNDGSYTANLLVWGDGYKYSAPIKFRVDRKPPLVMLSISTPAVNSDYLEQRGLQFLPRVQDDSALERWQLQILNPKGVTVALFWSTGPIQVVEWDGKDRNSKVWVTDGIYRGAYHAWDVAGNESISAFVDFKVEIAAREMLSSALKVLQYHTTPMGLIVQLPTHRTFTVQSRKVDLQDQGRQYLRDAAVLINAYPEVPISIEGYARTKKNREDRDLASAMAWRVYSFLVKEGHVSASRLHVRGRGAAPSSARREMDVLVLKHGVEIILEGQGTW